MYGKYGNFSIRVLLVWAYSYQTPVCLLTSNTLLNGYDLLKILLDVIKCLKTQTKASFVACTPSLDDSIGTLQSHTQKVPAMR